MSVRKNTNPRALDIAPQLQNTLNANGMQAQIAMTPTGEYQLVTMSHNTSTPRRYTLNDAQLEALMNGGNNVWDKKAYQTFGNYSAPPMGMSNRLTVVLQQGLH